MSLPERPRLRPYLALQRELGGPRCWVIRDQLRLTAAEVRVTARELEWLRLFDGSRTLHEIHAGVNGGVSVEGFGRLAEQLDAIYFLDSPRYQDRVGGDVRPPACIGCYEGEP